MKDNQQLKHEIETALLNAEVDLKLEVSVGDIATYLLEELERLRVARKFAMDSIRTAQILKENGINEVYTDFE